jgi:hypothetical protein
MGVSTHFGCKNSGTIIRCQNWCSIGIYFIFLKNVTKKEENLKVRVMRIYKQRMNWIKLCKREGNFKPFMEHHYPSLHRNGISTKTKYLKYLVLQILCALSTKCFKYLVL